MEVVPLNWMAVLLAAAANMALGYIWYSPGVFGNAWMKLTGMSAKDIANAKKDMVKSMPNVMGLMVLGSLLMAYVVAHMSFYAGLFYDMKGPPLGLITGFFLWLGMVLPVQMSAIFYEKQPVRLFLLHTGYRLVAALVMGMIVTAF